MTGARTITVYLKRKAKKSGGDRYESEQGFVIYIPQYLSRPNGTENAPLGAIKVTFEVVMPSVTTSDDS